MADIKIPINVFAAHARPIESFGKVAGRVCLGNQLGEVRIMRRAGIEIVCSELLPASSVTRAFPNRATAEWVEDCRGARQTQVSADHRPYAKSARSSFTATL
jgi:hypothetical protein